MKTHRLQILCAFLTLIFSAHGLVGLELPERISDSSLLEQSPYRYTGYVRVNNPSGGQGIGSGSVVGEGAILTAAHVVFDSDRMAWVTGVRMAPRHHQTFDGSVYNNTAFLFTNIIREASYSDRVQRDRDSGLDVGFSSRDTFNLDVATAARIFRFDPRPMVAGHATSTVTIDPPDHRSWMRKPFIKKVLGYPSNRDLISEENLGFMHEVKPDNYMFFWDADDRDAATQVDSGGFRNALYNTFEMRVISGNSGGPVYVWDPDFSEWVNSAVVVGGSSSSSLMRAIDDTVWDLIEAARIASGERKTVRATALQAISSADGRQVNLTWQDESTDAAEVLILRQSVVAWQEIARLAPSSRSYTDQGLIPGSVYSYAVQIVAENGNRMPRSEAVRVATNGQNFRVADALSAPLLAWQTNGDVDFSIREEGIQSGRVPSMGFASVMSHVTGPGELEFVWSVSSERNENLPQSGDRLPGGSQSLYDAFMFLLNGEVRHWISGSVGATTIRISLPEGSHSLEWRYDKDEYKDAGEDAGRLWRVNWTETGDQVIYGAFATNATWQQAHWWGEFAEIDNGWYFHMEFGWLWHYTGASNGFWSYSPLAELGWFFTSETVFPFVYAGNRGWLRYDRSSGSMGKNLRFFEVARSN